MDFTRIEKQFGKALTELEKTKHKLGKRIEQLICDRGDLGLELESMAAEISQLQHDLATVTRIHKEVLKLLNKPIPDDSIKTFEEAEYAAKKLLKNC